MSSQKLKFCQFEVLLLHIHYDILHNICNDFRSFKSIIVSFKSDCNNFVAASLPSNRFTYYSVLNGFLVLSGSPISLNVHLDVECYNSSRFNDIFSVATWFKV